MAKQIGDISMEVEMLVKAQCFEDSSRVILSYVLVNSLWQPGSKGWPLKQFMQKEELVNKAKINAKRVSKQFYGIICTEVDILSHEQSTWLDLDQNFRSSQNDGSVTGQILSARKIIDAHLHLIITLKDRENTELFAYLTTRSEKRIPSNKFSVETLIYFWNFWKDAIVNILGYLGGAVTKYVDYGEFCLNYLGVLKQYHKRTPLYLILNPEADWVRKTDDKFLHRNGKLVFLDASQFVCSASSYWYSELLSVCINISESLLFLVSHCQGYVFTTKALVAEWPFFWQWEINPRSLTDVDASDKTRIFGDTYSFIATTVYELLCKEKGTVKWLTKSNENLEDYPVLVLRLIVIMSLTCMNSGKHFDLLFDLLNRNRIYLHLPKPFRDAFLVRQKRSFIGVLAEALKQIDGVLVILSWGKNHFHFSADAIPVDDMVNHSKEGLLRVLFPKNISNSSEPDPDPEHEREHEPYPGHKPEPEPEPGHKPEPEQEHEPDPGHKPEPKPGHKPEHEPYSESGPEPASSNSSTADQNLNVRNEADGNNLKENYEHFCEMFNVLNPLENVKDESMETFTLNVPEMKVFAEKSINLIVTLMTQYFQMIPSDREDESIPRKLNRIEDWNLLWHANRMVDDLIQLSHILNDSSSALSEAKVVSSIQLLFKKLQSGKGRAEPFMRDVCLNNDSATGPRITENNIG